MNGKRVERVIYICVAVTLLAVFSNGCRRQSAPPQMPPPAVVLSHPSQRDVTVYLKYPGQVRAKEIIDIQARVRGYLESVDFEDGAMVKKGQKLFTIEKTIYEANESKAKADIAKADAQVKVTKTSLERMQNAYKTKAVSYIDVLIAEGDYDSAKANLEAAKAQLKSAAQDLSYTTVTAPVDGRISRHFVSVGNLVGATGPTKLAELVTIDPIEVYFNVDERTLLHFVKQAGGVRGVVKPGSYRVKMELSDGKVYDADGDIDYVGNIIDRETGTLPVRALFSNKSGVLISGMFAKVLLPKDIKQAILVPTGIIQRDMVGPFVYVVNDKGLVESKYVELGPLVGKEQVVSKGLTIENKVIIDGMIKVRPGIPVTIQDQKTEQAVNGDKAVDSTENTNKTTEE